MNTKTILIVPFSNIDISIIENLKNQLKEIFNADILIDKEIPNPDFAFNPKRNQYSGNDILEYLQTEYNKSKHDKILGIINKDLYVPELNFIFGLASEKIVIISITRLFQEFYQYKSDNELLNKRVLTEAVHELGHEYQLRHCNNPYCVMFFSNSLSDTDRKGYNFCKVCKENLIKYI